MKAPKILPKYWAVELDNTPECAKYVSNYLCIVYNGHWACDSYKYYGYDGNSDFQGTFAANSLEECKNYPVLFTFEEFKTIIESLKKEKTMKAQTFDITGPSELLEAVSKRLAEIGYEILPASKFSLLGNNCRGEVELEEFKQLYPRCVDGDGIDVHFTLPQDYNTVIEFATQQLSPEKWEPVIPKYVKCVKASGLPDSGSCFEEGHYYYINGKGVMLHNGNTSECCYWDNSKSGQITKFEVVSEVEFLNRKPQIGDWVYIISTGSSVSSCLDDTGKSHYGAQHDTIQQVTGITFKNGEASEKDPRYYGDDFNARGVDLRIATFEEFLSNTKQFVFGELELTVKSKKVITKFGVITKKEVEEMMRWINSTPRVLTYDGKLDENSIIHFGCQQLTKGQIKEIAKALGL